MLLWYLLSVSNFYFLKWFISVALTFSGYQTSWPFLFKILLFRLEKRAKFDQGEDPLDAEQQAQGHNPFHGFNHGGFGGFGEGFNFKFHFNWKKPFANLFFGEKNICSRFYAM